MQKLHFGTAGIPVSLEKRDSVLGIQKVKELGLSAMELEFVRGVHMGDDTAALVKQAAQQHEILLTAHAPYFINLNAQEPQKRGASRSRILKTADILHKCGGISATFHAAYYLGMDREEVYSTVKEQLKKIVGELKEHNNPVLIRPELTGKPTQWGDHKELIRISQEVEQVLPCIDFAHYFARYAGKKNTYEDFRELLEDLEAGLGRHILDNMHIHVSGINYGPKGEKNHLNLLESELNYMDLLKAWKEFDIKGVVVSESPNIEGDAMLLQKEYQAL